MDTNFIEWVDFNTTEIKLTMLAFLYDKEFMKNSNLSGYECKSWKE